MLERADEIKLVDLPLEALLEHVRDGKVYVSAQAQHAIARTRSATDKGVTRQTTRM